MDKKWCQPTFNQKMAGAKIDFAPAANIFSPGKKVLSPGRKVFPPGTKGVVDRREKLRLLC